MQMTRVTYLCSRVFRAVRRNRASVGRRPGASRASCRRCARAAGDVGTVEAIVSVVDCRPAGRDTWRLADTLPLAASSGHVDVVAALLEEEHSAGD